MMAGKAAIIKDIMGRALVADLKARDDGAPPTDLIGQYEAFKSNLIQDIKVEDFADIYAETIAYGLFAARLHDETSGSFTRAEALELLPKRASSASPLVVLERTRSSTVRSFELKELRRSVLRATRMAS